ncbi:unnamed protein product [Lymnaea stagnalis]|uniref:NR LBD domain-containing protein n=1 Tax=Lymnaea stagnalis TaxID=6523 RepID=A0AAV2HYQ1_LYMST
MEAGMNKDAVQHERGPRNSTIRRQVAMYLKESSEYGNVLAGGPFRSPFFPSFVTYEPVADGVTVSAVEPPPAITTPPTSLLIQPLPKYPHEMIQNYANNPEAICEAAARLLFMSVKWTKTVPAFVTLPFRDQVLLLEESWRELFVLGAAQFQIPLEAGPLLAAAGVNSEQSPPEKIVTMMSEVRALQETIAKFKALQVDPTEYICLKGIVLFKTVFPNNSTEIKTLREFHAVASLQDQAQLTLNHYIRTAYPTQPFRFGKLLLLLPSLRVVSGGTIEELFFRKTIGNIPIERLLVDMFKSGDF